LKTAQQETERLSEDTLPPSAQDRLLLPHRLLPQLLPSDPEQGYTQAPAGYLIVVQQEISH